MAKIRNGSAAVSVAALLAACGNDSTTSAGAAGGDAAQCAAIAPGVMIVTGDSADLTAVASAINEASLAELCAQSVVRPGTAADRNVDLMVRMPQRRAAG